MVSGHTPGPWRAIGDIALEGWVVVSDPGPVDAYCVVAKRQGFDTRHEEMIANAHLIATAPDLLARVKLRRANCVCFGTPLGVATCDECHADDAVIAKAEGR